MGKNDHGHDAHEMAVLASWRFAVLFSLLLTTSLWLFGALWIWLRDGALHDIGLLVVTWVFVNALLTPAIKWSNRRS